MKKIKQSISTVLPTAKIFLDDLEEIDKILKESCSPYNITFNKNENELNSINVIKEDKILEESYSSYTITLDEYELSSIDEIKEIKEKQDFHNLKIELTKPYFYLNMDKFRTYIYSDEDALCIGIIEKIKPIIQKRRKPYFQKVEPYILTGLIIILLIFILFLTILLFNPSLKSYLNLYLDLIKNVILGTMILSSIFLIVITIFILFRFWNKNKNKFIVFTSKKSDEPSNLFIKNKDQIILSSISAAIGALLVTLFTWFRLILTGQ